MMYMTSLSLLCYSTPQQNCPYPYFSPFFLTIFILEAFALLSHDTSMSATACSIVTQPHMWPSYLPLCQAPQHHPFPLHPTPWSSCQEACQSLCDDSGDFLLFSPNHMVFIPILPEFLQEEGLIVCTGCGGENWWSDDILSCGPTT